METRNIGTMSCNDLDVEGFDFDEALELVSDNEYETAAQLILEESLHRLMEVDKDLTNELLNAILEEAFHCNNFQFVDDLLKKIVESEIEFAISSDVICAALGYEYLDYKLFRGLANFMRFNPALDREAFRYLEASAREYEEYEIEFWLELYEANDFSYEAADREIQSEIMRLVIDDDEVRDLVHQNMSYWDFYASGATESEYLRILTRFALEAELGVDEDADEACERALVLYACMLFMYCSSKAGFGFVKPTREQAEAAFRIVERIKNLNLSKTITPNSLAWESEIEVFEAQFGTLFSPKQRIRRV